MGIYSIYKSTNLITGKKYIGFTVSFFKRKNQHKYESFNKKCSGYNSYFHKAIRKYGWNNFNWEIIYQSKDVDYCKKIMENYFITEYDTYNNGYNETLGGEGSLGFRHTEQHKENLNIKYTGKNNPMYGKSYIRDENHKKYMSNLLSGIKKPKEQIEKRVAAVSKNWILIDKEGNKFEIKNLKEFCRSNNLNPSAMGKVANKKQTNHKGWKCTKLN